MIDFATSGVLNSATREMSGEVECLERYMIM